MNDYAERDVGGVSELDLALQDIFSYLRRYVVLSDAQITAITLWGFHTHAVGAAEATPYLNVWSPEKESGKTLLFEVLELLVARPVKVSSTTAAALARAVAAEPPPTLLLDESDNTFKRDREYVATLLGVLNDGYRRGGKTMLCLPPRWEVSFLPVFAPKALAGIGALPDTLSSRSIPIRMKRKTRNERVDRFRRRQAEAAAEPIHQSLAALADYHLQTLTDARPDVPDELGDRAADVWEPLFAIADLAGGRWPEAARDAARLLSGGARRADSTEIRLLGHIRDVFDDERMSCGSLAEALNADEGLPYGGWSAGKGITTRELGHKLARYDIRAKKIRFGERTVYGYERAQFEDAWARYLPDMGSQTGTTGTTAQPSQKSAETKPEQHPSVLVSANGVNPHEPRDVPVVPVLNPETGNGAGLDQVEELPAGFTSDEWRRLQPQERELLTDLQREFVDRGGGRWLDNDGQ